MYDNQAQHQTYARQECDHCWHGHEGPIWIVLQPGESLPEVCCHCGSMRADHHPRPRCRRLWWR